MLKSKRSWHFGKKTNLQLALKIAVEIIMIMTCVCVEQVMMLCYLLACRSVAI